MRKKGTHLQLSSSNDLLDSELIYGYKLQFANLHKSKYLPKKVYMYRNADWESSKERINRVSEQYYQLNLSSTRSIDQNWRYIHHELLKAIQDFIQTSLLSNRLHLPWLSASLKRLINKKKIIIVPHIFIAVLIGFITRIYNVKCDTDLNHNKGTILKTSSRDISVQTSQCDAISLKNNRVLLRE